MQRFIRSRQCLQKCDKPSPTGANVLVRVHAASINPVDWKMLDGWFGMIRPFLTDGCGFDFAGTIEKVGPRCHKWQVGERVFGCTSVTNTGSLATHIIVPSTSIATVPERLTLKEAAAIPLAGLTAAKCMANVQKGASVLVLGGGTSVGQMCVQLAKRKGAEVNICTCSQRKHERLYEFGATRCVDYCSKDIWRVIHEHNWSFDVIIDTVATPNIYDLCCTRFTHTNKYPLKQGGQLITVTGDKQCPMSIVDLGRRGWQLLKRNAYLFFGHGKAKYCQYVQNGSTTDQLEKLVDSGVVLPLDDMPFVLSTASILRAFARARSWRSTGKVIVVVSSAPT
ncbi:NADP-dependent oxidoreductase [bacterium]|nr:NADP-dependent oxidoreductase [bacterium]